MNNEWISKNARTYLTRSQNTSRYDTQSMKKSKKSCTSGKQGVIVGGVWECRCDGEQRSNRRVPDDDLVSHPGSQLLVIV